MKKVVLLLAALSVAAPAFAFMTLRNCQMVTTMHGIRYIGTYCNANGTCVSAMFDTYCPMTL